MKLIKKIFKPLYAGLVLLAIGLILVTKKAIFVFNIKTQYKNVYKLDNLIQKLYFIVFNPYRISNGIRPSFESFHQPAMSDIETCHAIIRQQKQRSCC